MTAENIPLHYVCTLEEARKLIEDRNSFWVSNCGCREGKGECGQSRMDVCLMFTGGPASGSGLREISRPDVEEILTEAAEKRLVPRPFRDEETKTATEGVCFCCGDCCGYFLYDDKYACDKGEKIESTDMEACIHCGDCVDVCCFGARSMNGDEQELVVDGSECFGCGLCADTCLTDCIVMKAR